jgi:hypothetical protein
MSFSSCPNFFNVFEVNYLFVIIFLLLWLQTKQTTITQVIEWFVAGNLNLFLIILMYETKFYLIFVIVFKNTYLEM